MKKRTVLILLGVILVCALCAWICSCQRNSTSDNPHDTKPSTSESIDVKGLVEQHNDLVEVYNKAAVEYNNSVKVIVEANASLDQSIADAQTLLDTGETPFDPQAATDLTQALQIAAETRVDNPVELPLKEKLIVPENATTAEIDDLLSQASSFTESLQAEPIPEPLTVPDYTAVTANLLVAQDAYEKSVRIQKQITAPSDDFVIERLSQIDTILSIEAVTASNDPNGLLGTEGGYIGCIYFSDSRVDKEQLNLKPSEYDVISMGTIGGGAIEIYESIEEAESRNEYLTSYDNSTLDPGSHIVIGTLVIRTSSMLTTEQQAELTDMIVSALTNVIEA